MSGLVDKLKELSKTTIRVSRESAPTKPSSSPPFNAEQLITELQRQKRSAS